MHVLRWGQKKRTQLRITSSEVWLLGVHWIERSYLCATHRRQCPRCWIERPKIRAYAIGQTKENEETVTGLLELGPDILAQLTLRGLNNDRSHGFAWAMRQGRDDRRWRVTSSQVDPIEPDPPAQIADALEMLYRIPSTMAMAGPAVNRDDWLDSVAPALIGQMSFARKGAHS
jgi:hypothetical protein